MNQVMNRSRSENAETLFPLCRQDAAYTRRVEKRLFYAVAVRSPTFLW
jgi:hypothetical protein